MGDPKVSVQFTVLDGGSLVLGASIAAVHVRAANLTPETASAWVLALALFGWLSLTASGPFLYLSRRFLARPLDHYPQVGDRLWILWGTPWVISAVVEAIMAPTRLHSVELDEAYVGSLGLGLFLATMIAVPILASRYLWGDPDASKRSGGVCWTQRVGLGLTATWPLQCGVGLVLMG